MPEVRHKPYSGEHCESTMLANLLGQQGIDLSEEMVFGLGMGLNYIHWEARNMPFPFIGGRVKPDALAENLSTVLGVEFDVRETSSASRARDNALQALEAGKLVGLKLDHYHLEYFPEKRVHFHAHYATLYRMDGEGAWLIDTKGAGGGGRTSLDSLSEARSAKGPMSSKSRSVTVKSGPRLEALRAQLADKLRAAFFKALAANAHAYLNPPIRNLGYKGVLKSSESVTRWLDEIDNPAGSLPIIAMLMERAGTGGGLFRKMYGRFLKQGQELTGLAALGSVATGFDAIAAQWTAVAGLIEQAGTCSSRDALSEASRLMAEISGRERSAFMTLAALALDAAGNAGFSGSMQR
ncbi:hypothetical protein ASD15_17130 [Massilia sp. Root351]|jgi:hypothetical protein|uniref:BtrH N-terminal domain-containing protein n=1 Tax=Massilia sp. Root351 TaxID=1736522 RepID=UPI00070B3D6F|nr:BtrH N-terminal domain-containing protein [Massilia sp. Root351]KQV79758.1 hypothetical protein ASD15_17130 [Massilia sp. Root351]